MKISNYRALEDSIASFSKNDLFRLAYVSTITKASKRDKNLFESIQYHAKNYNKKNNIKGFLCNSNKYFLQCLEGRKQALLPLMANIFKDKRHSSVRVIVLEPIQTFSFADWRMQSLSIDKKLKNVEKAQDSLKGINFEEFMPFTPNSWPPWMHKYFINAMRKFDDTMQLDSYNASNIISYDLIEQRGAASITLMMVISFSFILLFLMISSFTYF